MDICPGKNFHVKRSVVKRLNNGAGEKKKSKKDLTVNRGSDSIFRPVAPSRSICCVVQPRASNGSGTCR